MATSTVNVFVTSFPGLDLPATLSIPLSSATTITELRERLSERIPLYDPHLIITTVSNRQLPVISSDPISDLLSSSEDEFLSLRISARLCGGKGGFGSQLRAAGGRMSSKRKKNQGENNGSNRNLDGRRLRTVTEAKALAEYLAIKPEMEKKEKEKRRQRWEQVIELAERREEEMKSGSKGKVDGKWVEDKEEAGERTRDAVLAVMRSGNYRDNLRSKPNVIAEKATASGSSGSEEEESGQASSKGTTPPSDMDASKPEVRKFFGFDEDDEFMSDEEDEDNDDAEDATKDSDMEVVDDEELKEPSPVPEPVTKGKAKSKATPKAKTAQKGRGKSKSKA